MQPQKKLISSIATKLSVLFATIVFISSPHAFAVEREAQVMERVELNAESTVHQIESYLHLKREVKGLHLQTRTLTDLNNSDEIDGKYFKMVLAETNEAIRFDNPDELLVLRATTAYYHLTKARNYFVQNPLFQDDRFTSQLESKIVVRVDQEHSFSASIHFAKTPLGVKPGSEKDYSTQLAASLTVPASNPHKKADTLPDGTPIADWGQELWFMKAKKRNNKATANQLGDTIDSPDFKGSIRGSLLYGDVLNLENDILTNRFPNYEEHGANMLLSIGISEIIPTLFKLGTKVIPQIQEMEPALIPELAYHEYTHVALANVLHQDRSTALNEGYPNYYAGKISGLSKLAARAGKYSKGFSAKKGNSKIKYSFDQDYRKWAAMSSFTYSLLNSLDKAFGTEDGEAILLAALDWPSFSSSTKLKGEFEDAIDFGIRQIAKKKFTDQIKEQEFITGMLLKAATVFEQKGLFSPVLYKQPK